jgi:putative endonuclease
MKACEEKSYQVYLVLCDDETLYCGFSTNVNKRVETHNAGKGAKYTKSRLPVRVVWTSNKLHTLSGALSLERKIKKMTRKQKDKMISNTNIAKHYKLVS